MCDANCISIFIILGFNFYLLFAILEIKNYKSSDNSDSKIFFNNFI